MTDGVGGGAVCLRIGVEMRACGDAALAQVARLAFGGDIVNQYRSVFRRVK